MKKLVVIVCLSVLGCNTENYSIRPSCSPADQVYVISDSGHSKAYSILDVVSGAVKYCDSKGRRVLFITSYKNNGDVKFMCVK